LDVLGGDYRFETRFYLDGNRVLYIHGGGDPFLVSEKLALLVTNLVAATGKKPITGIVLDASYYPSILRIPGIEDTNNAYNALNSALAVNFNTISAVRNGNKVSSAENGAGPTISRSVQMAVGRACNFRCRHLRRCTTSATLS
jgi:D-alanyl-D-alanine carboxypeptidase/D-alanyl-D-alanine-endopeptidase (penicillin-binding protein 4)